MTLPTYFNGHQITAIFIKDVSLLDAIEKYLTSMENKAT